MHARLDAAAAALDAALVRRAAAARSVAAALPAGDRAEQLGLAADAALEAQEHGREGLENDLSRALRLALPLLPEGATGSVRDELATAATRVGLARSFHNAAVHDTREIRLRRMPRALRLAGHRELPQFFEIDDTQLAG